MKDFILISEDDWTLYYDDKLDYGETQPNRYSMLAFTEPGKYNPVLLIEWIMGRGFIKQGAVNYLRNTVTCPQVIKDVVLNYLILPGVRK